MPHESFECALGIDPAIRVTYERVLASQETAAQSLFVEAKKLSKHVVRTFLTNNSPHPIKDLVVRDALPISSAPDVVKVLLKKPAMLAELKVQDEIEVREGIKVRWCRAENVRDNDGKYEWLVTLEGGKGCTLEAEWEVHMPLAHKWEEVGDT